MEIEQLKNQIHDPSSLADFQVIKGEYDQAIRYGFVQEKIDLSAFISELLDARGKDIQRANAELYNQYQSMEIMLLFGSFVAHQPADQNFLLQKRLLYAVQRGFNPDDIVYQYFSFFDSDEFVQDQFRTLDQALQQNTETLGKMPLETSGSKFVPELKYWFADYIKFPSKVPQRGAVERLNYINQSPNTRQLTQVQRQQLMTVFKLHDDFLKAERPKELVQPEPNFENAEIPEMPVPAAPAGGMPEVPVSPAMIIDQKLQELRARVH